MSCLTKSASKIYFIVIFQLLFLLLQNMIYYSKGTRFLGSLAFPRKSAPLIILSVIGTWISQSDALLWLLHWRHQYWTRFSLSWEVLSQHVHQCVQILALCMEREVKDWSKAIYHIRCWMRRSRDVRERGTEASCCTTAIGNFRTNLVVRLEAGVAAQPDNCSLIDWLMDWLSYNKKPPSSLLIGSWPLKIRIQTREADVICHATQTWSVTQDKCDLSRNTNTCSLARFVVKKQIAYSFPTVFLKFPIDNRWRHEMFKRISAVTRCTCCCTCSFEHLMTSSVINKKTDSGKLVKLIDWLIDWLTDFQQQGIQILNETCLYERLFDIFI